jgi:hypothetical protein
MSRADQPQNGEDSDDAKDVDEQNSEENGLLLVQSDPRFSSNSYHDQSKS